MTGETTLEDIAETSPLVEDRVMAREIIALREGHGILFETSDEHCQRLDALESAAAPAGCERKEVCDECGFNTDTTLHSGHLRRERDEARRERDAERANHIRVNSALCSVIAEKNALQQQLDASRAAVAKYAIHGIMCATRWHMQDCTCGLTDALAAAVDTNPSNGSNDV